MASPQCENGFTRIANELLEAILLKRIPGQELRVVLFVARKTYGFGKKADRISYGQIAKATGIPRTRVIMHMQSLVSKKVLGSLNNGTRQPSTIWINKDYSQWVDSPIKDTSPKEETNVVSKKGLEPSPNNGVPQKKEEKETIQKKKKPFVETSDEVRLSELLFSLMLRNNPKAKTPNIQTWAKHVDYMIRIDKRNVEDIEKIIRWSQKDSFWLGNILSTSKLRDKFDKLWLKVTNGNHGPKATTVYQAETEKKNQLFRAYLQDEAQDEKPSSGPRKIIDAKNSPETVD